MPSNDAHDLAGKIVKHAGSLALDPGSAAAAWQARLIRDYAEDLLASVGNVAREQRNNLSADSATRIALATAPVPRVAVKLVAFDDASAFAQLVAAADKGEPAHDPLVLVTDALIEICADQDRYDRFIVSTHPALVVAAAIRTLKVEHVVD